MYLVVSSTDTHTKGVRAVSAWTLHFDLEKAAAEYNRVLENDDVYSASICSVIHKTDRVQGNDLTNGMDSRLNRALRVAKRDNERHKLDGNVPITTDIGLIESF